MNILLLNHYAGTPELGMEFRPFYLAREWVRLGHRVQVLAANYSHVRSKQPQGAAPGAPGDQTVQGVAYRWYAAPPYEGNGLGRVKNIAAFLRAVWADTPRLVSQFKPEVVIASSTYPMDIWVARRLARLARAKLVYEVHDLWPLSPMELSGMSRHHPFIRLCQWAEDTAYRDADRVVSMLPKVHDHMASRGLDLNRLHIVPNGITLDEWNDEPPALAAEPAAALAIARAQGRTVVGYAGSMGQPNALDTLLDAASLLRDQSFTFVGVGSGHERAHLLQRVAQEGLQHVALLPPIPKAQVPAFLAQVDVAYIGWQPVSLYRFGIAPNKLMDYMMARCPVLHSVRAGNDPVAEAGCGLTVPPQDAAAVAQGLRQLAALPPAERQAMGERGRAFVLAHHTYPVLAQRFLEALR
jgi:glycosyltransferase involved in cell wall biosynthesis